MYTVSLDEASSYIELLNGIYLQSSASELSPSEREQQLEELVSLFEAAETAEKETDIKDKLAVFSDIVIEVSLVPPHQLIWAVYACVYLFYIFNSLFCCLNNIISLFVSLLLSPPAVSSLPVSFRFVSLFRVSCLFFV